MAQRRFSQQFWLFEVALLGVALALFITSPLKINRLVTLGVMCGVLLALARLMIKSQLKVSKNEESSKNTSDKHRITSLSFCNSRINKPISNHRNNSCS